MAASNDDILAAIERMDARFDGLEGKFETLDRRTNLALTGATQALVEVRAEMAKLSTLVTAFWQHRHGPTGDVEV